MIFPYRDFCDDGQRPDVLPFPENARDCSSFVGQELEKGDKPDREDCTVGEEVTFKKAHSHWLKVNQNVSFEFWHFTRTLIFYLGNGEHLRFVH